MLTQIYCNTIYANISKQIAKSYANAQLTTKSYLSFIVLNNTPKKAA